MIWLSHESLADDIARILLVTLALAGLLLTQAISRLKRLTPEALKQKQIALRKTLFADAVHEYRIVSPEDFQGLDRFFYEDAQRRLEQHQFKLLGDIENVTISRTVARAKTFTRCLSGPDLTITAGIRHTRGTNPRLDRRTLELYTEFNDGTFLTTNNTGRGVATRQQAGTTLVFCGPGTPLEELLRRHRQAMASKLVDGKVSPHRVETIDDFIQLQHRLHGVLSRNEKAREFKGAGSVEERARRLLELMQKIYSVEPHEHRVAKPSDYPNADLAFYEKIQGELELVGFRSVGDAEDLTATRAMPHIRTFTRYMVSEDSSIVAAPYHVKLANRDAREIDLSTEFSDGTFVVTTNSEDRARGVPGIDKQRFSYDTPANELVRIHRQRVASIVASHPDLVATKCHSLDDCLQLGNRLNRKKADHRQSTGYMTEEDFKLQKGRELNDDEKALVREIQRLEQEPASSSVLPAQT